MPLTTEDTGDFSAPALDPVQPGSTRSVLAAAERLSTRTRLGPLWIASRLLAFLFLLTEYGSVRGDVLYYFSRLHGLFSGGIPLAETLREYPLPSLAFVVPQYLLSLGNVDVYLVLFPLSMLALDGLLTAVLWRHAGRRLSAAILFWLLFIPVLGPFVYFRFDLVPSVLTVLALVALLRRPVICGVSMALGAATKLWPTLIAALLLVLPGDRRRLVSSFAISAAVLAIGSWLLGGWDRLVSPLNWQSGRGLQIESVGATPIMLRRLFGDNGLHVVQSRYQAFEVRGPVVPAVLTATTVLMVVGVALLALLWLRAWRMPSVEVVAWLVLAGTLVVTVANKVLSPQYMLWVGAAVIGVLLFGGTGPAVRRLAVATVASAALTHLIFPTLYGDLVLGRGLWVPTTLLLAARNILLVYTLVLAMRQTWRLTRVRALVS